MSQDIVERILYTKTTSPFEHLNKCDIGESAVLMYLFNHDKVYSGDISKAIKVSTARTSKLLNQLEKKKLIERKTDRLDKRKIIVYLTKNGENEIIKRKEKITSFINNILDRIDKQKINEYLDICEYFNRVINEEEV